MPSVICGASVCHNAAFNMTELQLLPLLLAMRKEF
jgi:hypothetical protein